MLEGGPFRVDPLEIAAAFENIGRVDWVHFEYFRAPGGWVHFLGDRISVTFLEAPDAVGRAPRAVRHGRNRNLLDRRIEAMHGENTEDIARDDL